MSLPIQKRIMIMPIPQTDISGAMSNAILTLNQTDMTPIAGGSIAGVVNWSAQASIQKAAGYSVSPKHGALVSLKTFFSGGKDNRPAAIAEREAQAWKAAACPVPQLSRTVASVAIYFTTYEYLKSKMNVGSGARGYSQHVKYFAYHGDHFHTTFESHQNCRGPFTFDKTLSYFLAAAGAGGLASASSMIIARLMMHSNKNETKNTTQAARSIVSDNSTVAQLIRPNARMANIATLACVALQSCRFGVQFSVFEQCKNFFAQTNPVASELTVGQVWAGALLGGVVAVSAIQPIQRQLALKLPCPLPSSLTSTFVPKCNLSMTSYKRALTRFCPIVVMTAVTYEFALRGIRMARESYIQTHPNTYLFSFSHAHALSKDDHQQRKTTL